MNELELTRAALEAAIRYTKDSSTNNWLTFVETVGILDAFKASQGEEVATVTISRESCERACDALSYRIGAVGSDPTTHGNDGLAKLLQEGLKNDELAIAQLKSTLS